MAWPGVHGMVYGLALWALHGIWKGLAGIAYDTWYGMLYVIVWWHTMVFGILWPGRHVVVYDMVWRAEHGIWYGLAGMAWYMVWLDGHDTVYDTAGGHGMLYGMTWRECHGL